MADNLCTAVHAPTVQYVYSKKINIYGMNTHAEVPGGGAQGYWKKKKMMENIV